jgi:hypothetical protein
LSIPFRCTAGSEERGESLIGTASTVRAFLLIEAPGSWGVDAVSDGGLPKSVKPELARAANRHNVRLLLIRKHGRSTPCDISVFASYADPQRSWVETTRLDDPADLLGLDLAALGAGRSPGLAAHTSPMFLVCTHGKHDVCCAERGRPVAAALHRNYPESTWEVSHIGGDRFAGNVLVLPDGLYYGRLSPTAAVRLAERHTSGHLDLEHLRGRSGFPFPVQAAEIFLRRELDRTALDALSLTARAMRDGRTRAVFTDGTGSWAVHVETTRTAAEKLTCRAPRASHSTPHALVSITPL